MALQKATLRVPMLGVSLDTKTDEKAVPTSRLLGAENAIYTKAGTLSKRHGHSALSTAVLGSATPYSGARGVAARDAELVLFTNDRCYSYVEGAAQWSDAGICYSVAQSSKTLIKPSSSQTMGDYAALNSIGVAAWEDSRGGVYYAVIEDDRGRVVRGPSLASATGSRPRCVVCGSKLAIVWAEATLGQLKVIMIDPAAPHELSALFPLTFVVDLVTTAPGFDLVPHTVRGAAWIAWNSTTGIRVGILDPSGVLGSPATGWPSVVTKAAAITPTLGPTIATRPTNEDDLAVTYAGSTDGIYFRVTYGPPFTAFTDVTTGAGGGISNTTMAWMSIDGGTADRVIIFTEFNAAQPRNNQVTTRLVDFSGSVQSDQQIAPLLRGCSLASKGFSSGSHAFVTLVHDVPLFGVYLTVREDGFCVARTLPGLAGDTPARPHLPSITKGGEVRSWTAVYKTALESLNGDQFATTGLTVVSLDFGSASSHQSAVAGSTLYLGAATPLAYDGVAWAEQQPHYGLDWETSETLHTNTTGGGGGLTAGTRNYVFWVEWDLATGETMRGPTSKPYQVVLSGADDKTTLDIPTLRLTEMCSKLGGTGGRVINRANARLCVGRTVAGDASAYYRCSGFPSVGGAGGNNGPVENRVDLDSVPFVDVLSDASLIAKEPVYTNGGVLSNDPVAASVVIAGGKNRLFATDPAEGNVVRFSQERADGYTIEWAPELTIQLDTHGGSVTAIGVLDDAVVLFKRSAIYAISGPGPLANPEAGGGWSAPQLVTSDVGCASQRSLAVTPAGLVFQSSKGIYLLDRSLQVSYIGAAVEGYNAQAVSRATLIDNTTQVRFLTASGATLCFDYRVGQWSTFSNHEGRDATIVNGVYHYLRTDGRVFAESSTSYSDGNVRIPMRIDTAWIHLQEHLQGFQRIWHLLVLGSRKSAHTLRIYYRLDYGPQWLGPITFDASAEGGTAYGSGNYGAGPYGGLEPTPYQWRFHLSAKCEAVQLRFEDYENASYGAAYELTELVLTGGVKGPVYKLPAARSA